MAAWIAGEMVNMDSLVRRVESLSRLAPADFIPVEFALMAEWNAGALMAKGSPARRA